MIVTQITATFAIIAAALAVVAAQYVDHRDRDFSWIDYLGAGAMALSAISFLISLLAFVWGL